MNSIDQYIYRKLSLLIAGLTALAVVLGGCGANNSEEAGTTKETVTIENCGEKVKIPTPVKKILVASESILSVLIELHATDQISKITSITSGKQDYLKYIYGSDRVEDLPFGSEGGQSLESIIAAEPEIMMAGFSMGFSEEDGVTPSRLRKYNIAGYIDSETCLPDSDDNKMGTMPPWDALKTNISNIGEITGHKKNAETLLANISKRRNALEKAEQNAPRPTVFNLDGASKDGVMTGGKLSISHAVIEASGARNAVGDLDDGKTSTISWETLAAKDPDFYIISDFPGGSFTYEKNVKELKVNPATKNLKAVKDERFIGVPGVTMRAAPPMLDAAEKLRSSLEKDGLLPSTVIESENVLPTYNDDYSK